MQTAVAGTGGTAVAAKAEVSVVLAEVAADLGAAEKVAAAGEVVVAGTAVVLAARAECSAVVTAGMPRSLRCGR